MEDKSDQNQIKDEVLEAIKSGQVKMRPRWKFIFGGVLFGVGVIIVYLALIYLVSFIISALRETGILFAPYFGSKGFVAFFASLPWVLIALSVLFLALLEVMVRRYQFGHHKPLLYSILGIIVLTTAVGIITAPWHTGIFRVSNLPIIGGLYQSFENQELYGIHRGQVLNIIPVGFVLEDPRGATSSIIITSQTSILGGPTLKPGDMVIIFGDDDTSSVEAYGIKIIDRDCLFCL